MLKIFLQNYEFNKYLIINKKLIISNKKYLLTNLLIKLLINPIGFIE